MAGESAMLKNCIAKIYKAGHSVVRGNKREAPSHPHDAPVIIQAVVGAISQ